MEGGGREAARGEAGQLRVSQRADMTRRTHVSAHPTPSRWKHSPSRGAFSHSDGGYPCGTASIQPRSCPAASQCLPRHPWCCGHDWVGSTVVLRPDRNGRRVPPPRHARIVRAPVGVVQRGPGEVIFFVGTCGVRVPFELRRFRSVSDGSAERRGGRGVARPSRPVHAPNTRRVLLSSPKRGKPSRNVWTRCEVSRNGTPSPQKTCWAAGAAERPRAATFTRVRATARCIARTPTRSDVRALELRCGPQLALGCSEGRHGFFPCRGIPLAWSLGIAGRRLHTRVRALDAPEQFIPSAALESSRQAFTQAAPQAASSGRTRPGAACAGTRAG